MDRKLLGAFTSLDHTYPPYTNISVEGDEVIVTVRGQPTAEPATAGPTGSHLACGPTVSHRMSRTDFEKFLNEVNLNFNMTQPLSIGSIREKLDAEGG